MKVTRLHTWWDAEQAWTAIELIDRLRDALWEDYGDEVTDMLWRETMREPEQQLELNFDNDDPLF